MRILFFTDKLTRGGAEKQIAQLAQPLHAAGHTICVMTIRPEGYWADWLKLQGIRVEQQDLVLWHEGRARSLLKIARLALAFRRFRPDVVISNKYHNSIWAMLAGRLAGVRLRIAYRVALSYEQQNLPARLRRFSYDATSAFVGNSKAVIDSLVQREGVPQERCRVIYQAVETPTVDPADGDAFRTEYDIPPDVTVIGLLANLHPIKNHSMLIRAVAMLCSDYPDVWSVFAGNTDQDQAYTQHLRAEIETHGLADRVVLTGRLSDTRGFLAAIDIGVLCSHAEGFSNALLEYMAYGKVPVATAVGGNPEAITHRETGFLIPPNDDKALAETLAVLLSDDRQRAQIGQQARQYVEKTFTAAREYEQWATLLEVHNG